MRTIRRSNQFKKDYKRETKGRSATYVRKLEAELDAVLGVPTVDGTLEPGTGIIRCSMSGKITKIAMSGRIWC
jgi:hypothetical protein